MFEVQKQINTLDKNNNKMINDLYGLMDDEIRTMEGN